MRTRQQYLSPPDELRPKRNGFIMSDEATPGEHTSDHPGERSHGITTAQAESTTERRVNPPDEYTMWLERARTGKNVEELQKAYDDLLQKVKRIDPIL